jgi:hypothetical protein
MYDVSSVISTPQWIVRFSASPLPQSLVQIQHPRRENGPKQQAKRILFELKKTLGLRFVHNFIIRNRTFTFRKRATNVYGSTARKEKRECTARA